MNFKQSILGSTIAFVLATSCCWLPWLIIGIGGATGLAGFSAELERFSGLFMVVGVLFFCFGLYQFHKKRNLPLRSPAQEAILESTITCPECQHQKEEKMPTDACQFFYDCDNCKQVLKPLENDCCVFCSYGTVSCPPIQLNQNCCD